MNASRIVRYSLAGLCFLALVSFARAIDETKTVTGEGKCAMVDMKTGSMCQTVIQVTDGKTTTLYYVADNEVAKKFHPQICGHPQKVTATGTIKNWNGKLEITPSKLEVVHLKSQVSAAL